ncbi:MAG: hypothetical protein WCQ91_05235 [Planctomycetota bacterium]
MSFAGLFGIANLIGLDGSTSRRAIATAPPSAGTVTPNVPRSVGNGGNTE